MGDRVTLPSVQPRRVTPTRVYRFYRGGLLIDRMRGEPGADTEFPEDWVGSVTTASNPGRDEPLAGLSRLEDGSLLRDEVAADPEGWLGPDAARGSTGVLVKLLDPAERLPVHFHPDRSFAADKFGSAFGKTEAWIVVATREEESEVWIGMREPVDSETYRSWIDRQDRQSLLASLNRVPVRAGDVVFVPAGTPHAIGAGALIAELQEPTDFSIVCEWAGFPIRPQDSHLGIGWDAAMGALDLRAHTPIRELPDAAREFFWADEHPEPAGRFAVWIVLDGSGSVDGAAARRGDCFVVPAAAEQVEVSGGLRILRCLGPQAR
jgi:mannose-6-phosphate isomerase